MLRPSANQVAAAAALRSFAQRHGIQLKTHFAVDADPRCVAFAYAPSFGSPNGLVMDAVEPPAYDGSDTLRTYAYLRGLFYSQVNAAQLATYSDSDFLDMFRDWGYFGERPPDWLGS